MASSRVKAVVFVCFSLVVWNLFYLQHSAVLRTKRKIFNETTAFSPEDKKLKWTRCKKLIAGQEGGEKTSNPLDDADILGIYDPSTDCKVLKKRFPHPALTKEEQQMPIAFSLTVYKGARLLERILQAIYMPNNVYCIHIDSKSTRVFRSAVEAMARCLPNVFISKESADVVWGHFSVVQAQLNCMTELLESSVDWKYYISLIGQDFPLYDNSQLVAALRKLNNTNSIESFPMPEHNQGRTKTSHKLTGNEMLDTGVPKSPPPNRIQIYKGSTHVVAIKEFVHFVVKSQIGKSFSEFLKDTYVPDETFYASLQQYPNVPGGIHGKQPEYIPRALHWSNGYSTCHGQWVRTLCWIAIEDLRWALSAFMRYRLFVHKIPFDYDDDLLECILVARQGRKYGSIVWREA
ncbi:beta-1,3-galactosyl-O-glycosyl-glycoprotein beta-1,6-N-acetylglucosaminyltransferase 3-like isoform X2 [Acropora muricata]|nr:beta-1,3-galactosyl-O-glycosyl-glycoprotein beta-1,6-N-acetylglucosaminyltransferase 3-like isoform X2 [Acropora millepora]XP_029186424.2 beta-1,3-galactosyl-O-glycosyl-glycoprotein beta-1,6-N-acetylglucosaminyltransferase 3-like isoform X2 [Acropora millepora]XP_029186425.2 beta-1,3-galactosyl-O-glycosyl-glycoprotein beta-1,6-N-acetylglucosaminyltransferase 3-like isoform X2 [Acropora millepora]XP_029186426.2 beta-1,3-galactosyl-O-glycosyl-glycoprotein beta-1,6-N-acetylglucosaminyltransferas